MSLRLFGIDKRKKLNAENKQLCKGGERFDKCLYSLESLVERNYRVSFKLK